MARTGARETDSALFLGAVVDLVDFRGKPAMPSRGSSLPTHDCREPRTWRRPRPRNPFLPPLHGQARIDHRTHQTQVLARRPWRPSPDLPKTRLSARSTAGRILLSNRSGHPEDNEAGDDRCSRSFHGFADVRDSGIAGETVESGCHPAAGNDRHGRPDNMW